jgi:hypothetical protein
MMNGQVFQDLNQRYFARRLPHHQVIVAPQVRYAVAILPAVQSIRPPKVAYCP